jgi:hypothetical protein
MLGLHNVYLENNVCVLRICCIITSEVEKCCLKYKNRGFSHNISTKRKQKYYFDSTIDEYKVDFYPLKDSKMCQYVIVSARIPCYLIVDDQLFISCVYMSEMKYTNVYIQFWRLISKIKFQALVFYPVK